MRTGTTEPGATSRDGAGEAAGAGEAGGTTVVTRTILGREPGSSGRRRAHGQSVTRFRSRAGALAGRGGAAPSRYSATRAASCTRWAWGSGALQVLSHLCRVVHPLGVGERRLLDPVPGP